MYKATGDLTILFPFKIKFLQISEITVHACVRDITKKLKKKHEICLKSSAQLILCSF